MSLLALLISVAVIVLVIWKMNFSSTDTQKSRMETNREAVQSAEDAKLLIEARSRAEVETE